MSDRIRRGGFDKQYYIRLNKDMEDFEYSFASVPTNYYRPVSSRFDSSRQEKSDRLKNIEKYKMLVSNGKAIFE